MAREFSDIFRDLRIAGDATRALSELAVAVIETQKAGTITITLKLEPNDENSLKIAPTMKVKMPEPKVGETFLFLDQHGSLIRTDPRQSEMPLRTVAEDDRPVKAVPDDGRPVRKLGA